MSDLTKVHHEYRKHLADAEEMSVVLAGVNKDLLLEGVLANEEVKLRSKSQLLRETMTQSEEILDGMSISERMVERN